MSGQNPTSGISIKALEASRPQAFNLMIPGPGIPWEDRGAIGTVKAFFKTIWMGLREPRIMVDHIRRPETGRDSSLFAVGCGLVGLASVILHGLLRYHHWSKEIVRTATATKEDRIMDINVHYFFMYSIGAGVGVLIMVILFQRTGSRLFYAMVGWAMKSKAPPVLAYNIFGYCLAPVILSLIPYAGPPLAAIWILFILIACTKFRMKLPFKESFTGSFIIWLAAIGIGAGIYYAANFALPDSIERMPPPAYKVDR